MLSLLLSEVIRDKCKKTYQDLLPLLSPAVVEEELAQSAELSSSLIINYKN